MLRAWPSFHARYVYVDGSAYKGTWAADALAGEEVHPQAEAERDV